MRVTTDGITIAVGAVIGLALGGATVKVVWDEANQETSAFEGCEPQPWATAQGARRHLVAEYALSEPESASGWFTGAYATRAEGLSQVIVSMRNNGIPVSDPIPEEFGTGYIVVVNYDPRSDRPSLPSCVEDTPVLYVGGGPELAG